MLKIKSQRIKEGVNALTIHLMKNIDGRYIVTYYMHAEDHFTSPEAFEDLPSAEEYYNKEVKTKQVQEIILNVARKRMERCATIDDIRNYQKGLLQTWKDLEMVAFITYLDRILSI